jgi:hypothetical protein
MRRGLFKNFSNTNVNSFLGWFQSIFNTSSRFFHFVSNSNRTTAPTLCSKETLIMRLKAFSSAVADGAKGVFDKLIERTKNMEQLELVSEL